MKESIHKYFKLGTLQWMSFPNSAPLDALTAIARDDFFDAVEIKSYGAEKEQAKAILDQSHLTVCFGAHPMQLKDKLNPNALDESERQKAEDALKGAIDEAAYLGATAMAFLAGHWEEATKEQAYAQLVKTTNALCDYAAEKGLGVELEVFDYDVDKAALIGPAPLAARFAADVCSRHKNFGLIVDLSHIPITHENTRFVIRTLRPYITHFHYGNAVADPNCDGYGDKHPRFGYPNSANEGASGLLAHLEGRGLLQRRKSLYPLRRGHASPGRGRANRSCQHQARPEPRLGPSGGLSPNLYRGAIASEIHGSLTSSGLLIRGD